MAANIALAVLKFVAYLLTGSPSMLAETYHSISDTGNQVLLLVGMYYSKKRASRLHPFGYGKATFFYAFLVSVLLFGIAGWESLQTGLRSLSEIAAVGAEEVDVPGAGVGDTVTVLGNEVRAVYIAYAVLVMTILFDGASYLKAQQALSAEIRERGWRGFADAFRRTSDMPVLAVLTENAVAAAGAFVALVAIFVSDVTGNPVFDAFGAVVIGVLLMTFAVALGIENKRLLLGEALSEKHEIPLKRIVRDAEGVAELVDLRTVYFGPENVLVTADVAFDPDLDTAEIDDLITEIEDKIRRKDTLVDKVYIEPESNGDEHEPGDGRRGSGGDTGAEDESEDAREEDDEE